MSNVPPALSWVSDEDSASSAARALTRSELRGPGLWLLAAAVWLSGVVFLMLVSGPGWRQSSTLAGSVLYGMVPATVLVLIVAAVAHFTNVRSLRRELVPGVRVTARLGIDTLTIGVEQEEATLGYAALASVESAGEWVIVRLRASGNRVLLHQTLLGEGGLVKLIAASSQAQQRVERDGDEQQG